MLSRDDGKRVPQVFREWRTEVERLAGHRVVEREPGRVEEMPLGRKSGHTTSSAPSIHVVAHDRMADRREMNADLMSPSGMEMRTKKVPRVEPGKAYEVGLGRPTLIDDCHALAVSWITGYRLVDRDGIPGEMSPRHDRIAADHPARGQSGAQEAVSPVSLGHDEQSGGLLVQAMHHASPFRVSRSRDSPAPSEERVHQSAGPVPRRGVDYHSRRLVHHQQGLVLVHDADGNVLSGDRSFFDLGDVDPDDLACCGSIARLFPAAVDQYMPLSDERRRLRP